MDPPHLRLVPLDRADDGFGAAPADCEVCLFRIEFGFVPVHPIRIGSTKSIDSLPSVTNCNNTRSVESFEHCMITGVEILPFVDHDKGKLREWSSEQRGHVNLVVKVNRPVVRCFDRSGEDRLHKAPPKLAKVCVEAVGEFLGTSQSLSVRELSFWAISKRLCEGNGGRDLEELVISVTPVSLR